ncbi:MAG TPA: DUF1587 domain-containing protein, partial [Acidobacteria bacterium]|nr:DUF1587 domain-containing protein [Acidobacteriota bacterium]
MSRGSRLVAGQGVFLVAVAALTMSSRPHVATLAAQTRTDATAELLNSTVERYCITCHNDRLRTADLSLADLDLTQVGTHAELWEGVVAKLRTRAMPPVGRPRPETAVYDQLAGWIETEIDRVAAARPNPGRTEAVHRLNRAEYANAVRDLLALDVDVATLLPA